jgi:hypothetical protein
MREPAARRVTVYVNDEPRRLFLGLRVRHAVGYRAAWHVERGEALIQDAVGNQVDLDGALYDGERLYVVGAPDVTGSRSAPGSEPAQS